MRFIGVWCVSKKAFSDYHWWSFNVPLSQVCPILISPLAHATPPRPASPPSTRCNCGFKQSTHAVQERESIHSIAVLLISMTRVLFMPASFFLPLCISNLFSAMRLSTTGIWETSNLCQTVETVVTEIYPKGLRASDWDNRCLLGGCRRITGQGQVRFSLVYVSTAFNRGRARRRAAVVCGLRKRSASLRWRWPPYDLLGRKAELAQGAIKSVLPWQHLQCATVIIYFWLRGVASNGIQMGPLLSSGQGTDWQLMTPSKGVAWLEQCRAACDRLSCDSCLY